MARIALTIAGSDSGGGAGVQADLKTMSALGVYGASAITAVTAQNTRGVTAIADLEPSIVAAQIDAVLEDLDVRAIKIGMLSSAAIIEAVSDALDAYKGTIVLDPVMVAKSGDALLRDDAVEALARRLLPRAHVLTPNLPEAARLLGGSVAASGDEMRVQGEALLAFGPRAVLMKGGHMEGDDCADVLVSKEAAAVNFTVPRMATKNTHGTGCTLSAAIAAGLAKGEPLAEAVGAAHAYLQGALRGADALKVGAGCGPLHHFHEFWAA